MRDAFYCQVEQVRLGESPETPLCVQQWNGLVAVNYAARKFGIKRHCTVDEAKKLCPGNFGSLIAEIKLVHVATFANGESEAKYHENPKYSTHKVSLDPYRRASAQILAIVKRFCKKTQRASIDEAYLDLTDQVNDIMSLLDNSHADQSETAAYSPVEWTPDLGNLLGQPETHIFEHRCFVSYISDLMLYHGAKITAEIRKAIFDELGYTCSAGIAHNKTLAKLCSSMFKPNQQSALRDSQVLEFVKDVPMKSIRHLGGKFGKSVEEDLGIEKAGDLCLDQLKSKFGDASGVWLYNICRGVCMEDVQERQITKSMAACKSLRPYVNSFDAVMHWVAVLSAELYQRLHDDFELHQRWPKTLVIHYSVIGTVNSKSAPFITRRDFHSPDILTRKVSDLLKKESILPCSRIALNAANFVKEENIRSIKSFFSKAPPPSAEKSKVNDQEQEKHEEKEKEIELREDHFLCDECKEQVPLDQKFEHEDFHVALKLQKKENIADTKLSSTMKKQVKPQQKPKRGSTKKPTDSGNKKQKLLSFFTKSSNG